MAVRIGVDVGGTFTDLVLEDGETGQTRVTKVPSTPSDPASGVLNAVSQAIAPRQASGAVSLIHGHTVGLNALLERRGAKIGLLATEGFRDLIEIRRGDRADPYDLFWKQPEPLVPRHLRVGVRERTLADGTILGALDEQDVRDAAALFLAERVDCVAIAFMNAYAHAEHELRAARLLADAGFGGPVSLSHAVSGEYREYERTSTTLIDAYIRPRISNYLQRLERELRDSGISGPLLVSRSGGGAVTFAEARERPCDSIMSGPVGGAQGAARIMRSGAWGDAVTADVGGTSFDTCMIVGGRPVTLYEGEVTGFPLQTPWVDVRSIGAGGGSLAYLDAGGLLRVGPQSSGAEPGPACYGRGGTAPTVTDAALLLGMLGHGRLAGDLQLDADAALGAYEPLAARLELGVADVARGVMTIAAASMANAIREITIEQGRDPRELTLIAFGGAGPMFAGLLARELGIGRVVVPPNAGNFSAHGLLGADVVRTAGRTRIARLDDAALAVADALIAELLGGMRDRFAATGMPEAQLDLRYVGQEHTLTLDVPLVSERLGLSAKEIAAAFAASYERRFGVVLEEDVEMVAVRTHLRESVRDAPSPSEAGGEAGTGAGDRVGDGAQVAHVSSRSTGEPASGFNRERVSVYSMQTGEWMPFAVIDRAQLDGGALSGPAIITEPTATTYLDVGFSAERGAAGLTITDELVGSGIR